jgi:hypothetical protein
MGFADTYVSDVWAQRNLVALYPPAGRAQIGDVYEKQHGVWSLRSRLTSRGFTPKVRRSKSGSWQLKSNGNISLAAKLRGKAPAGVFAGVLDKTEAGIGVTFKEDFGYVMSLANVTVTEMTNAGDLAGFVRDNELWQWDNAWMVVTAVFNAGSATILTSDKAGSHAVLRAKAGVKIAHAVDIANLSVGLELASESTLQDRYVCETKLTPLFRGTIVRWRDIILGGRVNAIDEANFLHLGIPGGETQLGLSARVGAPSVSRQLVLEEFDPTA